MTEPSRNWTAEQWAEWAREHQEPSKGGGLSQSALMDLMKLAESVTKIPTSPQHNSLQSIKPHKVPWDSHQSVTQDIMSKEDAAVFDQIYAITKTPKECHWCNSAFNLLQYREFDSFCGPERSGWCVPIYVNGDVSWELVEYCPGCGKKLT